MEFLQSAIHYTIFTRLISQISISLYLLYFVLFTYTYAEHNNTAHFYLPVLVIHKTHRASVGYKQFFSLSLSYTADVCVEENF